MATVPSAFYGQYASDADISFLAANVPDGTVFGKVHFGGGTGGKKDEIFYVEHGDKVKGGKGYDAVVQSEKDGVLGPLKLHKSVESGTLTGDLDGNIKGNGGDNNLVGNAGDNVLKGGGGKDVLVGNDGDDTLVGGKGKDVLLGDEGADVLKGGKGNDLLYGGANDDVLKGGKGNDRLFGEDGNDTLKGGDGGDRLFGLSGDDKLFGQDGKDTLLGGVGNDTLFGGSGKDILTGDAGADVFGFLKGEKGMDVVTDFQAGVDTIDLSDFHTSFSKLKFENSGDDVVVTVGHGKSAVKFKLLGYHASDIDGSFFQF